MEEKASIEYTKKLVHKPFKIVKTIRELKYENEKLNRELYEVKKEIKQWN